jgi:sterol 3beta-glucosyltransferase
MRIDILAFGQIGEVQPYVALGLGLQKVGHRVRIVTVTGFDHFVRSRGLDHFSLLGSTREIEEIRAERDWLSRRRGSIAFLRGLLDEASCLIEPNVCRYWQACQDIEALIVNWPMGFVSGGTHIAERLRVPLIRAQVHPRYDWSTRRNLAASVRGALMIVGRYLAWSKLRRSTNVARSKILTLPPLPLREPLCVFDRQRIPMLGAYSPVVAPKPPHWGDWMHVTGYWFLDNPPGWQPPGELVTFLGSGPPPVFVGFGSAPFPEPETATQLVVRALARAGRRGVILSGGSGLAVGRLAEEVLSVDFVPHSWLFSQVCAAVHHGGAGVTGEALRAGLPSVVIPVWTDQPFWARRVFELGVGPRPIPAKRLTEDALASAILATESREMRSRASMLAERIRQEDGVARAVEAFHRHISVGY